MSNHNNASGGETITDTLVKSMDRNPEVKDAILKEAARKHASLKLLAVILSESKAKQVENLFNIARVHMQFQFRGEGTASSELMSILGLGSTAKVIAFCLVPANIAGDLMKNITDLLILQVRGNGIAFTLPISGAVLRIVKLLDEEAREKLHEHIESEVEKMKTEATHELIISVTNPGYSEDVMDVAKQAGATGGTVIHARQAGGADVLKVFGVSIQGEREIVAILTEKEKKLDIMKAINGSFGFASEAKGLTISLPVDGVAGL